VIGVGTQQMSYIDTAEFWKEKFGYGILWVLFAIHLYYGAWLDFGKSCIRLRPRVSKFV
jgi:hypothetical protein